VTPKLIVAFGDSTTAGTPGFKSPIEAPNDGKGDPTSQYAYWLVEQHPDWRILNRGVNGERTDEIAARFDRDVLSRQPKVVVVIAGVNDIYQGRSVESVTTNLRAVYDRAIAAGIQVVAGTILPYNTATPEQNAGMHAVNAWIADQAAADPNIAFVDTRAAVADPNDPDRLAQSPDDLHPGVEGYRRMASALGPAIEERLKAPGRNLPG
jgi:lysophospholipase L1-like esterase